MTKCLYSDPGQGLGASRPWLLCTRQLRALCWDCSVPRSLVVTLAPCQCWGRGLGWPLLLLGVPCRAIPLHHPTGRGPRHSLWGPDVAPCDVGIPTFDPTVTAAPSPTCTPLHLNTGPTCSPLHRGAVPPQPAAPWQPHSTLCPGQYLSRWERAGGRCLDPGASRSREAPSQPQPSCTPRVCLRR